jgi:omega-6 fatty acid desaturase (delta-12 desaturase)
MLQTTTPATATRPARDWMHALAAYREPDRSRSIMELVITAGPLFLLWGLAWAVMSVSPWLSLALTIPAAAFLVRLFLIQHDCGHGSFFRGKAANDWVGRVLGVFTMTPYDVWRRSHAIHHATTGNLDERGMGDITTLTVKEYNQRSWWGRLRYKLYRHPLVMFGIGPAYVFLIQHRLPFGFMKAGSIYWISAMATNAAIALVAGLIIYLVGIGPFLLVHLPTVALAATMGVWLFYVQHQFEDTFWDEKDAWQLHDAALYGSSYYDLPPVLRWLTANIGMHHVHHLYARIPYYRLPAVLKDYPELGNVRRLTIADSIACVRLRLWDEDRRRLVTFDEARRVTAA